MKTYLGWAFALALILSHILGYTPLWLSLWVASISVVTYAFYARDKTAAQRQQWRIPEKTLQSLALAGGWPGAMLAQERLRHKTQKRSFRIQFWLLVLANISVFLWLHSPLGQQLLTQANRWLLQTAIRLLDRHWLLDLIRSLTHMRTL